MINHLPKQQHNPFPAMEDHLGMVSGATGSETWVEDAYGERAWMPDDAPGSSQFIGLAARRRRLVFFFACLIALLATLWGKTAYLMAQSGSFKLRSDLNRIRTVVTVAPRGIIFDRNGVQLTDNVPDLQLAVVPADLPEDPAARRQAIAAISKLAGVDPAAAEQTLNDFGLKGYQPVTLAPNITRDQAVDLTIAGNSYPAIRVMSGTHRFYGLANAVTSLSHILGYMGRITADDLKKPEVRDYQPSDAIGRTGVEYAYEKELRGTPGVRKVEVDAIGNEVNIIGETAPAAGESLRLSIDAELSKVVEESLQKTLDRTRQKKAAAVVEDVRSGEILALVSLPGYPDNLFAQGISSSEYKALANDPAQPLFNRAISGQYPPGSTAKLMVAAAALAEGVITPKTSVNSVGGIMYGGIWWFPDWQAGGHGVTDVKKAIAWSVNTFFYMIGGGYESFRGLGVERLGKYFRLFGVGEKLGIDLPNEAPGFVPSPEWKEEVKSEAWYIGDTYHISIGQGDLLATPLQMVSWTAAVANGGTLWRPHLAQAFVDDAGSVIEKVEPTAIRTNIVDDQYLATVRAGMRDTVLSGSAQLLKTNPMQVAGKTGTAQFTSTDNHAWFTSFAPYDDPQIAVTVLFERGVEGSSTSVPVANEIYNWYYANRMNK